MIGYIDSNPAFSDYSQLPSFTARGHTAPIDGFQRLKDVLDFDKNVLENYRYHYRP